MFRVLTALRIALLAGLLALVALAPRSTTRAENPVPPPVDRAAQTAANEYILHYDPGTPFADVQAMVTQAGGTTAQDIPQLNAVLVRLPTGRTAVALSAQDAVAYLEPNLIRYPTLTPNDPRLGEQWGLTNIRAFNAWNVTTGTSVVIAILDTGADLNHPDLNDHLLVLEGWDFVDNDAVPQDMSSVSHGTHVTGIANAETNNSTGIAGVAWNARTLPVRIIGSVGASSVNIANGIVYATDHGAQVINMSLGGPGWVKIERDAVNYAAARGVVVVAAAGNAGSSVNYYPASYDHVISVANTQSNNTRNPSSNFNLYVDIAAPGTNIVSTILDDTYGMLSGTSMASPHVSGTAALVWSAGHAATAQQVMEALLCSSLDLGSAGRDNFFGYGLVQADAAVNYIPGTSNCLPNLPPDDFDTARAITSSLYTDTLDTTYASWWEDDPTPCAVSTASRSVWYRYTPALRGKLTLDTAGSAYDTLLAVYTGTRGSLVALGCNDDANGTSTSSYLELSVTAGQTYYVLAASKGHEGYEGTLTLHTIFNQFLVSGCYPTQGNPQQVICMSE